MKLQTILAAFIFAGLFCRAQNSVILKQTDAPLVITSFKAWFQAKGLGYSDHPDQIKHDVEFRNASGKEIAAIQIGLAAFDVFNNFMGVVTGVSIDTIQTDGQGSGSWEQRPDAAFAFQKYGTGIAYVKAVRFADGSIWQADMAATLLELQKFEKDLKKEDLQEKKK